MESYNCPMKNCNNNVKCKCFEIDFDEGIVYFCSPKCLKNCVDESGFDVEDYEEHLFECEQQGEYGKEWTKKLQKEFIKNKKFATGREHYWHKKVEALEKELKEALNVKGEVEEQ